MADSKKIFVLDTNVILHDSSCIYQFQEHNVVVPIAVIEELDQFKKGHRMLNFHAREFVRTLDSLTGNHLFDGGVKISPNHGRLSVKLEMDFHPDLAQNYTPAKPDHHILNTAYQLSLENPRTNVILVTKDMNLRMKAKAVGLMAQDYTTDHVSNVSELYKGSRIIEHATNEIISKLYKAPYEISPESIQMNLQPKSNEYFIIRNQKKSALARYNPFTMQISHVDKMNAYGIKPKNAEQTFSLDALLNPEIQLVSLTGKAGTGKTLLALASALECMKQYRQIYMARPVVPLSNKDIGYLPGDIESKLDPYMQPLYDNLAVIQSQFSENSPKQQKIKDLLDTKKLIIAPLSYIRGRSLVKIFFIVDEAQNLTPHEVKTIITRAGEETKIVFTGDIFQIDHPYLNSYSNGLSYLIEKMQGQKLYAHINLEKGERSELAEMASNLL